MAALFKSPNLHLTRIPKPTSNSMKLVTHFQLKSKTAPASPPPTSPSPMEPFIAAYIPKPEENMVISSGTESGFYSETDGDPLPAPKSSTKTQVKGKRPLLKTKNGPNVTSDLPKTSKLSKSVADTKVSTTTTIKKLPLRHPPSPAPPPAASPAVPIRITRSKTRAQVLAQTVISPTRPAATPPKVISRNVPSSSKSPKVCLPASKAAKTKPRTTEDEWRLGVQKREAEYQKRLKEKDDEFEELRRNYANEIETYKANISAREAEWQRLKEQYEVQVQNLYAEHKERYIAWETNLQFLTLQCGTYRKEVDDLRESQVRERELWQEDLAQKQEVWEGSQNELSQRLQEVELFKNAIQAELESEKSERLKDSEEFEARVGAEVEERVQAFHNQFAQLQQEVTSHQSVLELKNSEIRQLRAQALAEEGMKQELYKYKDMAASLHKRTEDLEARLQAKVEEIQSLRQQDQQIRTWCRQVSQDKKRLSMEVEQLQWKLGIASENTSPEPSSLSGVNQSEESLREVQETCRDRLVVPGVSLDDFDTTLSPVTSSGVVAKTDSLAWTVKFDDEDEEHQDVLLNDVGTSMSSTPKLERRSRKGMFRSLRENKSFARPVMGKSSGPSLVNGT